MLYIVYGNNISSELAEIFVSLAGLHICMCSFIRNMFVTLLRTKKRARTQNVLQRNYTQNCSQSLKSRVCGTTNEKVTISDSNVVVVVAVYLEIEYPRFCCFIFLFFFVLFLTSKIISECQELITAPSEYEPIRRTNFNDRFHGSYNFSAKKPCLFLKHIHCMLSLVLNHQWNECLFTVYISLSFVSDSNDGRDTGSCTYKARNRYYML